MIDSGAMMDSVKIDTSSADGRILIVVNQSEQRQESTLPISGAALARSSVLNSLRAPLRPVEHTDLLSMPTGFIHRWHQYADGTNKAHSFREEATKSLLLLLKVSCSPSQYPLFCSL